MTWLPLQHRINSLDCFSDLSCLFLSLSLFLMSLINPIYVTGPAASAIFNTARLAYAFAFGITTTIIFSKLPGGSSTRFQESCFLFSLAG